MPIKRLMLLAITGIAILTGTPNPVFAQRPVRLAVVDTGNTGRSVTAEALALDLVQKTHANLAVISRAVDFNPYNIHPELNFASLLIGRGIDITAHRAEQFTAQDAKFSDVILTMTLTHKAWITDHFPDAKDKVFTISEYVTGTHTDVADAFGKPMEFYAATLSQLEPLVEAAVKKATAPK